MRNFIKVIAVVAIFSLALLPKLTMSRATIDMIFSEESFENWKYSNPDNIVAVERFERYLARNNVFGVLPTYQILRTASMAKDCNQGAFEVPPNKFWPNIVTTLEFTSKFVVPEIGRVEAVSGYRNPELNTCAGGAKRSAHTQYFALDMIPTTHIRREDLIQAVCRIHNKYGEKYGIGLGFYNYTRFHIDSRSFRRWGANGASKTSPCADFDKPEELDEIIDVAD